MKSYLCPTGLDYLVSESFNFFVLPSLKTFYETSSQVDDWEQGNMSKETNILGLIFLDWRLKIDAVL